MDCPLLMDLNVCQYEEDFFLLVLGNLKKDSHGGFLSN